MDYISYAPPNIGQDKAVYCHYHFSEQIFTTPQAKSQCHFIYLDNDRLITEDISDLERLHLTLMYGTHQFYKPYALFMNGMITPIYAMASPLLFRLIISVMGMQVFIKSN